MTDRPGWDDVQDEPSWIDPVLQARNAEDRIVHALRERGLVRSQATRRAWVFRLVRPLAFAAAIAIVLVVGSHLRSRDDAPPVSTPRPHGVPTTPPEVGYRGEVRGVAFHQADPLEEEGPLGTKPIPEANEISHPESSPAFHLSHPLDSDEPEDMTSLSGKQLQLAVRP